MRYIRFLGIAQGKRQPAEQAAAARRCGIGRGPRPAASPAGPTSPCQEIPRREATVAVVKNRIPVVCKKRGPRGADFRQNHNAKYAKEAKLVVRYSQKMPIPKPISASSKQAQAGTSGLDK
jgi:hypothetical protein